MVLDPDQSVDFVDDTVVVFIKDAEIHFGVIHLLCVEIDIGFIDCEQGSPDVESVENMARAARVHGMASVVRLFSPEDWVIERYLFRGVDGVVMPRVDTAEQAQRVVDAVRYCVPPVSYTHLTLPTTPYV